MRDRITFALVLLGALGVTSCVGGGSWMAAAMLGLALGAGVLGACQRDGNWEQCCKNGRVTTCYCPPNTACNYGWSLASCGDAGMADGRRDDGGAERPQTADAPSGDAAADAPAADSVAGDRREEVATADLRDAPSEAVRDVPEPGCDAGAWCINGQVTMTCCPPNAVCNFGQFVTCPDGTCYVPNGATDGGPTCRADAGADR